ncbi:AbrB family transcriptional regulator [Ketobacter sp. MCCC 1A13808]|uniref:antitoxin n=1 Tax=Ketobacter sp. MCCC 1A13808 TaxID=2602738 RepID=UPI0012EC5F2D|nr:AbrB family transcriptional regulator [Ketobacter sp. MCCC 1A13808]MVF14814.1 AbrB family transcriptional regulator [Ketobacter sp. MCCC 1A13808]
MRHTVKLLTKGSEQVVVFPADCRFDCDEVYVRRDPKTGDVILSRRPGNWDSFFELVDSLNIPDDFMSDHDQKEKPEKKLF